MMFWTLLKFVDEPYRTMVLVAQCLGLRISEVMALQWSDFDFANLTVRVQRGIVHGHVDVVKTEYSNDDLPLDVDLCAILQHWKQQCPVTRMDGCSRTQPPSNRIGRKASAQTTSNLLR
jgi:integrase